MGRYPATLITIVILLMAWEADAGETFRCGNGRIVSVGDFLPEVYVKCGEPTFRDRRIESSGGYGRWGHRHDGFVTVEEWVYNLGSNEFMYRLKFADGRLVRIDSLDHGFDIHDTQ